MWNCSFPLVQFTSSLLRLSKEKTKPFSILSQYRRRICEDSFMKTKQVYLRRLLVFAVALVVGMLVFPSVVPYLAVRVFVPDAPQIRPARKHSPSHQFETKQNPGTTEPQQLKIVEVTKAVAAPSPATPQAILEEIPSWKKPPEVTLPLAQVDDTFSHAFLAWNVQSGESDARVIADQLRQLPGYDVYCLTEVLRRSFPRRYQTIRQSSQPLAVVIG